METSKIKSAIEILDNANFLDPENLKMLQKFSQCGTDKCDK